MPRTDAGRARALAQALQNGAAAQAQGRLVQAEQHCLVALKTDSRNVTALHLLGSVVAQQGRYDDAVRFYRKALRVKPDNAQVHCYLGNALSALKRFNEAIPSYRRAVALQPDYADAHFYLALALNAVNLRQQAGESHKTALVHRLRALARDPGDFVARHRLGVDFERMGNLSDALRCCRDAIAINPEFAAARGAMAMYRIPDVLADDQSAADARIKFERELSELDKWLETTRPADGYTAFESARVFYLAYQEQDNLALLSRYGDLCARTMKRWKDAQTFATRSPLRSGKLRIGIVLAFVLDGPVWNAIVRGWVEHFDRTGFELHLIQLEPMHDKETEFAKARTLHLDLTGKSLRESVDGILERQLDLLIYPELGMHRRVAVLASLRLAPVQAASWGHPETTGLPTIDYFLSAEDLEPPDAQKNYGERLVKLPQLGCCYHSPPLDPVIPDLARMGIAADRPVLLCAGSPFKYAPEFDWVLVEIARRVGSCQLVFFVNDRPYMAEALQRRLAAAFARCGLALHDHAAFIPWQDRPEFYGLLARADVLLDTIGFSGFNTAMQAIECGLPVVTREGRYLRGRLASGVLKRMGLTELVAATEEEYVDLAIKLAGDSRYRQQVRRRIETSRHLLIGDLTPIRALERFCADVLKRS